MINNSQAKFYDNRKCFSKPTSFSQLVPSFKTSYVSNTLVLHHLPLPSDLKKALGPLIVVFIMQIKKTSEEKSALFIRKRIRHFNKRYKLTLIYLTYLPKLLQLELYWNHIDNNIVIQLLILLQAVLNIKFVKSTGFVLDRCLKYFLKMLTFIIVPSKMQYKNNDLLVHLKIILSTFFKYGPA